MQNDQPQRTAPDLSSNRRSRPIRPLRRLMPFIMIALMAFIFFKDKFPVVNDTVMGFISPAQQRAIESCRDAAMKRSPNPGFTRMIRLGEASRTTEGFLVNRIVIGVPDENSGEKRLVVTCHIGSDDQVVNFHVGDYVAPAASNQLSEDLLNQDSN